MLRFFVDSTIGMFYCDQNIDDNRLCHIFVKWNEYENSTQFVFLNLMCSTNHFHPKKSNLKPNEKRNVKKYFLLKTNFKVFYIYRHYNVSKYVKLFLFLRGKHKNEEQE